MSDSIQIGPCPCPDCAGEYGAHKPWCETLTRPRRFRKRPVVITATQFEPLREPWPEGVYEHTVSGNAATLAGAVVEWRIDTLEGPLKVSPGDWIITGIKGEKYPCKSDIFEATYESVE